MMLHLDERYRLSIDEYEVLLRSSRAVKPGTRNVKLNFELIPGTAFIHGLDQ